MEREERGERREERGAEHRAGRRLSAGGDTVGLKNFLTLPLPYPTPTPNPGHRWPEDLLEERTTAHLHTCMRVCVVCAVCSVCAVCVLCVCACV